jgi:type I restriction enzyme S subunit
MDSMGEWKEIRLRDVCTDISYGYTASATDKDTGYKFLRITDIVNSPFSWDSVPFCEINEKDSIKYHLSPGDIVIARTGATTGTTYTVKDETNAVYASYLIKYQIDRTQADPFFIGYCLRSDNWKGYVENIIGGSAQPGANAQQFADYEISLPSITEQQSIAEVLSSLDDKIELLHRQNKTLEQMAETLFRQWFVEGKDDTTEEVQLTYYATNIKRTINPAVTPDLIFNHYSLPAYDNGQKPDFQSGKEILSNKYKVEPGQILISKLNPRTPRVWYIYSCTEASVCSTEFQVFQPKNKEFTEFIYCWLKSNDTKDILSGAASGTSGSHQRVSPDDICGLTIFRPEETLLREFHLLSKDWLKKIAINNQQINSLEKLRDSLLPKLMNGSVRITNN